MGKTINEMTAEECKIEATDMLHSALNDVEKDNLTYTICEAVIESTLNACEKYVRECAIEDNPYQRAIDALVVLSRSLPTTQRDFSGFLTMVATTIRRKERDHG